MKYGIILSLFVFVLGACGEEPNKKEPVDEQEETPIVGKWKLQTHKKKDDKETEIDLKSQPTQVILSILDGGYFVLYDTFVDPKFNQKGFSRISERSKGQWEFRDGKKLVLRHNREDTTIVEELIITLLNKNTLVTQGKDNKATIYKTYQGY
ncbi:MAG: hypothetical protein EP338_12005 [Bacteroidetes bacterium]|nr:MAG: hypothetical protein EP338_12005 [Bacteroidota bacterium]